MRFHERREIAAVLQTALKTTNKNNFAIHTDVYEQVRFKVGMMSHSVELYILILVSQILIRSQECEKSKEMCVNYLTKFQSLCIQNYGLIFFQISNDERDYYALHLLSVYLTLAIQGHSCMRT